MEHGELELAVAVDETSISEEVHPVFHLLVKCPQEPCSLVGPSFQEFSRFEFPRVAKMADQHVAHLPAMTLLFAHDAHQALQIIVAGRGIEEASLLFGR